LGLLWQLERVELTLLPYFFGSCGKYVLVLENKPIPGVDVIDLGNFCTKIFISWTKQSAFKFGYGFLEITFAYWFPDLSTQSHFFTQHGMVFFDLVLWFLAQRFQCYAFSFKNIGNSFNKSISSWVHLFWCCFFIFCRFWKKQQSWPKKS